MDWRDSLGKRHRDVVEGNRDDAKQRLSEILKEEGQVTETKQTKTRRLMLSSSKLDWSVQPVMYDSTNVLVPLAVRT